MRLLTLAVALVGMGTPFAAQAEIVLGGTVYPDSAAPILTEYCQGLQAQSQQSLTTDIPDDVYSGDLGSAYQLKQLPFGIRDCRRAGLV